LTCPILTTPVEKRQENDRKLKQLIERRKNLKGENFIFSNKDSRLVCSENQYFFVLLTCIEGAKLVNPCSTIGIPQLTKGGEQGSDRFGEID
jgi:hypothetical protein